MQKRNRTAGEGISNYDIMRADAKSRFLTFDQENMIANYHMAFDKDYLYLPFVGRLHRISRKTGTVEWTEDDFVHCGEADFDTTLTFFDILCRDVPGNLSGKFCGVGSLKGIGYSAWSGKNMFGDYAKQFDGNTEKLVLVCEKLGGRKEQMGDVAYELPVFPFLPMKLQFWEADDEFDASLTIQWDENILQFMRYETTFYATGAVLQRISDMMNETEY